MIFDKITWIGQSPQDFETELGRSDTFTSHISYAGGHSGLYRLEPLEEFWAGREGRLVGKVVAPIMTSMRDYHRQNCSRSLSQMLGQPTGK